MAGHQRDRHLDIEQRAADGAVHVVVPVGAAVVAARLVGEGQLLDQAMLDQQVQVNLPGGSLSIEWRGEGQPVIMTGPATTVFEGQIQI